ncbi:MAG TPA: hypothetical protein VMW10_02380 [Alphaproteobacteria bacterium]|nr:hypothetical protein [Alphaproteobacteria bacterium]
MCKDIEINGGNNSRGSPTAVRACLKHLDYVVFKELGVNKKLLRAVKGKLLSIKSYIEARRVIEDYGLKNADEILAYLGYRVQWKGLDVNVATIGLD